MTFSAIAVAPAHFASAHFAAPYPVHNRCRLPSRHTVRWIAVALLIVFFSGYWAVPAQGEIQIEPRVGFHGVFQLGRPFPLEIELNNSGRPAEGVLEVQVWKGGATKGGAPFAVNYRRQVFLAAQARKTIQLTVDPDFISRPLRLTFSSPAGAAKRELDLRRYFSPTPLLLFLSESNLLPPMASATGQHRLIALSPGELAADPRALLGVSHVILYDQSLRDLSRAQLAALDTWLSSGGRMVIIGSLNFALYQDAALSRFLPVRVSGTRRITFKPSAVKDEPPASLGGVWALQSTLVNGKVLAESDGVPVLVEASRGRGRIIYFALDIGRPPLAQWSGLPRYLQTLLAPASADDQPLRSEWNDAVFAQLIASPTFISTYVPSGSMFVAMILYLAGLGGILWLWQRKSFSGRATLGALFGLVSAGTVAGYFLFNRGGNIPDGVLMTSTLLESSGDGYVEAQANLALFSTQPRPYDLEMNRGWMELTPVSNRARDQQAAAVVQQDSNGVSRYHLPLREWDYRLFRMRLIDRFQLRAEFEAQGDQLIMKIDNQSGKDLTHCWLLVPGRQFDLGRIAHGATWRKTFSLTPLKSAAEASTARSEGVSFREVRFPDKTRDILFHSSFFPRDGDARWASGVAVFFGWVNDFEPKVRLDDARIQRQDYALYRAIIPLAQGEDE